MRWYRELYLGPNAAPRIDRIRKRASQGKWMAGVYYVILSGIPVGLFEIIHSEMLLQPLFAQLQRMDVVGVAWGRMEALRLVERLVGELYGRTGSFDAASAFPGEAFQEI